MGKPESEEAEGCREQGGPRVVPSFDGDPAPWDFGAFGGGWPISWQRQSGRSASNVEASPADAAVEDKAKSAQSARARHCRARRSSAAVIPLARAIALACAKPTWLT
jgi:hypothetical protein